MKDTVTAPRAPADQAVDTALTNGVVTTTPQRHKLKLSTRIALMVILTLAVVAGGVFATSYFLNARNYVSTDNAQIDGDKIQINAPTSGTLLDWSATEGTVVTKDQRVGRVEMQGGFFQPKMSIRAPSEGTVAMDNGVPGVRHRGHPTRRRLRPGQDLRHRPRRRDRHQSGPSRSASRRDRRRFSQYPAHRLRP